MTKPLESWARLWDFRRFRRRLHDFSSTDDISKASPSKALGQGKEGFEAYCKSCRTKAVLCLQSPQMEATEAASKLRRVGTAGAW